MATYRKRGDKWHVQVRRQGHAALTQSFIRKADAEAWARQTEAAIERGTRISNRAKLKDATLGHLLTRYAKQMSACKKGCGPEVYRIGTLQRHTISLLTLDQLSAEAIAAYRDHRLEHVSPPSVRRELVILRHCLQVAIDEWDIGLTANPMLRVRKPISAPNRERRVAPGELERLATALRKSRNPLLVSVINLAIFTGMRRSELLGLTWKHVDLKKGLAFLPDSKNGYPRIVPLSPAARTIISGLNEGKSDDLVLPVSANAVRLSWERLKVRAGIENLHFHDLRHEAISRFFEAGLSVPEVSLISGHRDPRMLLRYTHLKPETVANRLSLLVEHNHRPVSQGESYGAD